MQSGRLIVGTLYDNIAGIDGNISEQEVTEILKALGLDERKVSDLLHARLEECKFSYGEMQKLLIAQAIVKRNKFIFLDEATSSMDNESQNMVLESIKQIPATKIIVAQRLETVKICDKIIVFENGKIIKTGTYNEIMR
jgi:ATP-binding cassette subfamily C protein